MSADDSEESRCPDFATASIETQSRRRTVAQRSSSATDVWASPCAFSCGFGSGTGRRWVTRARLAFIVLWQRKWMAGRRTQPRMLQIAALVALAAAFALSACGEKSEPDLSDLPPPTQ